MRKLFRVVLVVVLAIVSLQLTSLLVGAQGGSWVSGFMIQNQDTVNPANVTIKFYWAEGTPSAGALAHTVTDVIPAGQAKSWFTPSIPGLPDGFIGSVVVESDRPVAAIVNTQVPSGSGATPSSPNRVGTASGVLESQTGMTMYVTQIMKAYYGWGSYIAVQNTTGDTASVTVRYYDATGAQIATNTQSLHPYSTYVFRQESEASLPSGFAGSAKIEANKNVAVICNFYNAGTSDATAQFHSFNGLSGGATKLYAPRIVKDYYDYQSGLKVQNVGTIATVVTVQYRFGASTYTQTSPSINPGQAWGPYLGPPNAPAELTGVAGSGSATITASQPIIATVNEDNRVKGQGITYNAFLDGSATSAVLFPQVTSKFYGYSSGVQIQNVSTEDASCTVTYSMPARADVTVGPFALVAGTSWSQFLPSVIPGQDFNGSAVVVCNKNTVGISNMSHSNITDPRYPLNYGDNFTTYNGINK
jgi:hypothetical protein